MRNLFNSTYVLLDHSDNKNVHEMKIQYHLQNSKLRFCPQQRGAENEVKQCTFSAKRICLSVIVAVISSCMDFM